MRFLMIAGALTLQAVAPGTEKTGDIYVITREARSSSQSDGSSSRTSDGDTITERVIDITAEGVELEYDLSPGATADDRARVWQFPARILRPSSGTPRLLNASELATRLDRWLTAANLPRATCGHWIFTWNAFKIECDPQSVLETIAGFDLRPADLREGAIYRDRDARDPAPLTRIRSKNDGATYTVTLIPDPDKVRRDRAESDVIVGEISRKPVTLDTALRARSAEKVTGSITILFDVDASGAVIRRTKTTKLEIRGSNGAVEKSSSTETLSRTRASPARRKGDGDTI